MGGIQNVVHINKRTGGSEAGGCTPSFRAGETLTSLHPHRFPRSAMLLPGVARQLWEYPCLLGRDVCVMFTS